MFFKQLILDYEIHLLIATGILFLVGIVSLAFSHKPYYTELPEELHMPVKLIRWRFRLGIYFSLLGLFLIVLVILAKLWEP
jgi:hypothetical protein